MCDEVASGGVTAHAVYGYSIFNSGDILLLAAEHAATGMPFLSMSHHMAVVLLGFGETLILLCSWCFGAHNQTFED